MWACLVNTYGHKEMKYHTETRIRLHKISRHSRISKVYQKKAVTYANKIEVFEYHRPVVTFLKNSTDFFPRKEGSLRTDSSVSRARLSLYRLVEANTDTSGRYKNVFVTLTYAKHIDELKEANRDFRLFIKRLNNRVSHALAYVCVPEWTKKNRIHFHIVFFNLPFFPKEKLEETWGLGFTQIEIVKNIRNNAAYLAKYFSKSAKDPRLAGKKAFFASKGLLRPVDIYGGTEVDEAIQGAILVKHITNNKNFNHKIYEHEICRTHERNFVKNEQAILVREVIRRNRQRKRNSPSRDGLVGL